MPNRIIKESVRTSKSVNALTDFQFRLWAYLITYVDDFGRGSADPDILKGFVFPLRKNVTAASIRDALENLACMGLIQIYTVDGDSYLCFPNWSKHQTIRAAKSKFPAPADNCMHLHADEINCKQLQAIASNCKQLQANVPVFDNRESIIDNRESRERIDARARFTPPTAEEVRDYAREKGWTEDQLNADRFVDFYASKGWKVGSSPMKDWKAAARSWVSREAGQRAQGYRNPALDYEQRQTGEHYGEDLFIDLDSYSH